ncbi:4Fe-4S binding protein [bacterium]|nr:4Fe-4S binding protein [bacterium]
MITIDQNRCTGCGECINVCPFGAISIQNNKASINNSMCRMCSICIDACPEGAISDEKLSRPSGAQENNQQRFNPFSAGMGFPGSGRGQGQGRGMGRGRNNSSMGTGRGMGRGMGKKGRR